MTSYVKERVAWSGELEFLGASEDDRTGRTVQFRIIRAMDDIGLANPFSTFTRRRRGHAGTRFEAVFVSVETQSKYSDEIMLLNWADGPKGATVKFLLSGEPDHHIFLGCERRTRERAGTIFMAALMELDDDNTIVNQAKRQHYEKAKQRLSNVAAIMIKSPRFHEWLLETVGPAYPDQDIPWNPKRADEWLKRTLIIESKAELDGKNVEAAAAFVRMRATYIEWLEANNYDREDE